VVKFHYIISTHNQTATLRKKQRKYIFKMNEKWNLLGTKNLFNYIFLTDIQLLLLSSLLLLFFGTFIIIIIIMVRQFKFTVRPRFITYLMNYEFKYVQL
jgi:hypothetical protein